MNLVEGYAIASDTIVSKKGNLSVALDLQVEYATLIDETASQLSFYNVQYLLLKEVSRDTGPYL